MNHISHGRVLRLFTLITSSVVIVTIVSPFFSSVTSNLNSVSADQSGFTIMSSKPSGNDKRRATEEQEVPQKIASEGGHDSATVNNSKSLSEDRRILEEESYRYLDDPSGNLSRSNYKVLRSLLLRNKVLQETCDRMERPFAAGLSPSHLLVDDRNKYIFCEVRKVSSITWRKVLDTVASADPTGGLNAGDRLRRLGTYSKQGREHRLRHYTKFMFVREPMLRVFSGWREKFVDGPQRHDYRAIWGPRIKRSRPSRQNSSFSSQGRGEAGNISFSDFVGHITGPVPSPLQRDVHWQPYLPRCRPCRVRYDLIGHYETLGPDAEAILQVISPGRSHTPVTFPKIRPSRTPALARREFLKLDYEDIVKLARLYELDYKLFGYSFDQFKKWLDTAVADG